MEDGIRIRAAVPGDAAQLLRIYAPYVERTAISFEYAVPTLEEFRGRMERTLTRYPFLAAEKDGELLGYASTKAFVPRAAYDWAAETTVYVRWDRRGMGLGPRLYQTLEAVSRAQNITNLNACIGWPETPDEYLTRNSADFHAHIGFRMVGRFRGCGYKFGRWYDMVWMEKIIQEHRDAPPAVIPFPALDAAALARLGISG